MDWNKSNTILVIAFIVLNIFLLLAAFGKIFSHDFDLMLDKDFVNNVETLLKSKNINVKCEIPKDKYILSSLDTEYEIVQINNNLIKKYLGEGVESKEDVYRYSNDKNEILEIIYGKKIKYTIRDSVNGKINNEELINENIKDFINEKNINDTNYFESYRYISENKSYVIYTRQHNQFNIDNSYMCFFVDKNGVYEFEMQRINNIVEIKDNIRIISSIEALTRLMTYADVKDKDIIEIKIVYYSLENGNWEWITRTDSNPTWKVIFSDGTQKYLPSFEQNQLN